MATSFLPMILATILVYEGLVHCYNCPSPCICRDNTQTVFCNRTGLNEVPQNIPNNVVTLYLGQNSIKAVNKDAFKGLQNLTFLDLSGNMFKNTSFMNGALIIASILTLDLSFGSYMSIPQGLPPNLTTLYFFNNPIQVISKDSFVNASTIQYLELRYNQITIIEDHAFDPLVNASEIDISFNKIIDSSFSPKSFIRNQKLWSLEMRFNALTTFPDTTHFPRSLQHLDFVGNRIKTIPSFALKSLPNLQTLEVWEGAITTVEDNAFSGLNQLTILDFMEDHVSSKLTNLTFNGLISLKQLFFDGNSVSEVDVGAFYSMKNIRELWFSSNKMTTLVNGTFDLSMNPNLSMIYIDDNPWYCDCKIRWIRQMMDDHPDLIQDPQLTVCNGPPALANKAWDELKTDQFVCH